MKGFTLLEVMIVVVLAGIIGSMAMLAIGNGGPRNWQQQEAERLLALFKMASQEAMASGAPIAVQVFSDGYRFLQAEGGQWQPEQRDTLSRPRSLPEHLRLALSVDGLAAALRPQSQTKQNVAHIVFTPDGDLSRFQITLQDEGNPDKTAIANTAKSGLAIVANASKP